MDHAAEGDEVNQPVQLTPRPAGPPPHAAGGREREREQQDEAREADRDERALGDVLPYPRKIEKLVEPDVRREVEAGVEKSEQAEHAAELDRAVPAGKP